VLGRGRPPPPPLTGVAFDPRDDDDGGGVGRPAQKEIEHNLVFGLNLSAASSSSTLVSDPITLIDTACCHGMFGIRSCVGPSRRSDHAICQRTTTTHSAAERRRDRNSDETLSDLYEQQPTKRQRVDDSRMLAAVRVQNWYRMVRMHSWFRANCTLPDLPETLPRAEEVPACCVCLSTLDQIYEANDTMVEFSKCLHGTCFSCYEQMIKYSTRRRPIRCPLCRQRLKGSAIVTLLCV